MVKRLLIVAGGLDSIRYSLLNRALAGAEGVPLTVPHPHTKYANGVRLDPYGRRNDGNATALRFLRSHEPFNVVTAEGRHAHEVFCREAEAMGYEVCVCALDLPQYRDRFKGLRDDTMKFVAPWLKREYCLDGTLPPAVLVSRLRTHPSVERIREYRFVENPLRGRSTRPPEA